MTNLRTLQPSDPAYLKAAFSLLGLSEIEGARHEKKILAMYAAAGHAWVKDDETPWCAAYVNWALAQAGLKGTGSLMARSFAKYGRGLDRSKTIPRGAIAVWPRGAPPSGHVNFVIDDDGTYVTCIGGNQSKKGTNGAVTISRAAKADAISFRMPITSQGNQLPRPPDVEPVPVPRPKPPAQDTELPDPQPAPAPPSPPEHTPWWKKPFVWLGTLLSGGLMGGNLTVDAQFLWGLNATILLVALLFAAWIWLFPPRGKFFKGVFK